MNNVLFHVSGSLRCGGALFERLINAFKINCQSLGQTETTDLVGRKLGTKGAGRDQARNYERFHASFFFYILNKKINFVSFKVVKSNEFTVNLISTKNLTVIIRQCLYGFGIVSNDKS